MLRFGIGENWEVRLETGGLSRREETTPGETSKTETGVADIAFGAKWHWLDPNPDGGTRPSAAWLFHVEADTGTPEFRGDGLRPSVRFSMEWDLPKNLAVGVMPGVAYQKEGNDRFGVGVLGVVLARSFGWRWGSFVELALETLASSPREDIGFVDLGATYRIKRNWQVDTALRWGITNDSPDFAWTFGLSAHF